MIYNTFVKSKLVRGTVVKNRLGDLLRSFNEPQAMQKHYTLNYWKK